MTNKEAIKYLQQLYPNGGHCWLDEQRIEAIGMAVKALQKEPVSEQKLSNVERTGKNWKPSEEQITVLHDVAAYIDNSIYPNQKDILVNLYLQLKKLREE